MRGGPSLKGKGGLVGFRKKNLRVREDWWVFEKKLKAKGGLVEFRETKTSFL